MRDGFVGAIPYFGIEMLDQLRGADGHLHIHSRNLAASIMLGRQRNNV